MDEIRIQIIAQKIFEVMEFTGMSDEEFFDRCLRQPIDTPVGIKNPETNEVCLGFCNHKDGGLMFYLPEDMEFSSNEDHSTQIPSHPSKSEVKRQILMKEFLSSRHPDNDE